MKTINILIVIDASGALSSGSLMDNVYLVDTNKYLGSWHQGTNNLHTVCQDGQLLTWKVKAICPDSDVSITRFSGELISEQICNPTEQSSSEDKFWQGRIETRGRFESYQYKITISIDGATMDFSSYVKVV